MAIPLLVAVCHENERLIGNYSLKLFKEKIAPYVTNKTLVLQEGFTRENLLRPAHPIYDRALWYLQDPFGLTKPTIGGFDSRTSGDLSKDRKYMEAADVWPNFAANIFGVNYTTAPQTFEELQERVLAKSMDARARRTPTLSEIEFAKIIERGNTQFDQRYIAAINRYRDQFDRIILVAGGAHCLSIASKTGYSIDFLVSEEDSPEMYYAYLCDCIWPSIVTGSRTAT
jgi:hypothetical protein